MKKQLIFVLFLQLPNILFAQDPFAYELGACPNALNQPVNNVANRTTITKYEFTRYSDSNCATPIGSRRSGSSGTLPIQLSGFFLCSDNHSTFTLGAYTCAQGGASMAITALACDGGGFFAVTGSCVAVTCSHNDFVSWSIATPNTITTQ